MKYHVERSERYDFIGQSYGEEKFPNLHKYPATMIPQIGIEVLNELNISSGSMLDPYCGSGSSFVSGLACGIKDFMGFDLNPLAIAITKVRFSKIDLDLLEKICCILRNKAYDAVGRGLSLLEVEKFNNFDYWFSMKVASELQLLKNLISSIRKIKIKDFLLLALSSVIRECSYVRNNEFKLFRMKEESLLVFNPDVLGIFFETVAKMVKIYEKHYYSVLDKVHVCLKKNPFSIRKQSKSYDVILTSPPYGDSKTTVAYGQFSFFANSWAFGVDNARALDNCLMGGKIIKDTFQLGSIIDDQIAEIKSKDEKRAREVLSFYKDLGDSINDVSKSIASRGFSIYIVGNRTVKQVNLKTDQFIAEQFEKSGLKHRVTYERVISNKRMPKYNSPTNEIGKKMSTINNEFIVICQK